MLENKISFEPCGSRILFVIGVLDSKTILLLNSTGSGSDRSLGCGKVLAVGPAVIGIEVGDWIEIQRNVIVQGLSVLNDLRRIWEGETKYIVSSVVQEQVVGVIRFLDTALEPGLLLDSDLDEMAAAAKRQREVD